MPSPELETVLRSPRCIISVMGSHAGEEADVIFKRKSTDITRLGKTFWLFKSQKAQPSQVQELCLGTRAYVIFVEASSKNGASPTITKDAAKEYSDNKRKWYSLPAGLSPVTGKLSTLTAALVFDQLTTDVQGTLDLWSYSEFPDTDKALKFMRGYSTVCAVRKDMRTNTDKMKSQYRTIVALARLVKPYCVWVR